MKFSNLLVCSLSLILFSACSQDSAKAPHSGGRPESDGTQVEIQTPGGKINFSSDQPCVTLPGRQFFQFTERGTLSNDGKTVSFILVLSTNGTLSFNFTCDGTSWLISDESDQGNIEMEDNTFSFRGKATVLVDMKRARDEDIGVRITCF